MIKKLIIFGSSLLWVVVITSFSLVIVTAFTGPTANPPTEGGAIFVENGNIGVGTSSPGQRLTVKKDDGVVSGEHFIFEVSRSSGTQPQLLLGYRSNGSTGTSSLIRSANNLPLTFGTSGANEAVTISDIGYVGIGTVSPINNLHIKGPAGTGVAGVSIESEISSNWLSLHSDSKMLWKTGNDLQFGTTTSIGGGGFSEKVRINSSGQVGIGRSSISAQLDVQGTSGIYITRDGSAGMFILNHENNGLQFKNGATSAIYLTIAGTGRLDLPRQTQSGDPATTVATKGYVDSVASGSGSYSLVQANTIGYNSFFPFGTGLAAAQNDTLTGNTRAGVEWKATRSGTISNLQAVKNSGSNWDFSDESIRVHVVVDGTRRLSTGTLNEAHTTGTRVEDTGSYSFSAGAKISFEVEFTGTNGSFTPRLATYCDLLLN